MPSTTMPYDTGPLLQEVRRVLQLSQVGLADLGGASRRTAQRWDGGQASPGHPQLQAFARAVYPVDPALAAKLAAAGGSSLAALGLGAAVGAPEVPPNHTPLVAHLVCAAADALDLPPKAVRPALLAAFRLAHRHGLTVEDVEQVLLLDAPPAAE